MLNLVGEHQDIIHIGGLIHQDVGPGAAVGLNGDLGRLRRRGAELVAQRLLRRGAVLIRTHQIQDIGGIGLQAGNFQEPGNIRLQQAVAGAAGADTGGFRGAPDHLSGCGRIRIQPHGLLFQRRRLPWENLPLTGGNRLQFRAAAVHRGIGAIHDIIGACGGRAAVPVLLNGNRHVVHPAGAVHHQLDRSGDVTGVNA